MIRYFKLISHFARISLIREIGFKSNFVTNIFVEIAWSFVTIFGLEVMFFHTNSIAGWNKGEVFLIYAFYRFMSAFFAMFFRKNIRQLPFLVNTGELDLLIIRPINTFFYLSTRVIAIDRVSQIIISLILLAYSTHLLDLHWNYQRIAIVIILSISGSFIRFTVSSAIHTISIWLQKLQNLERLELAAFGIARYPRQVFPQVFSQLMTFVLPIMFVAAIPAEIFLQKITIWYLPLTVVVSLISVFAAYQFFFFALRYYSSASS